MFLTPKHLGIAMEFVPGGNLYQRLREVRTIPEPEARWFFQQLIIAVEYTHRLVSTLPTFYLLCCLRTILSAKSIAMDLIAMSFPAVPSCVPGQNIQSI